MPDLSQEACHKFWFEYNDPSIYKAIGFLESVEDWTLEKAEGVERLLETLGRQLDNIAKIDVTREDLFVKASAHLKSSQILRILQALDTAHPGAASKVLSHAEENVNDEDPLCRFFIQRNIAFERLRLLSRIFARDRVKLAIDALESEDS